MTFGVGNGTRWHASSARLVCAHDTCYAPAPNRRAYKAMILSDICLSVCSGERGNVLAVGNYCYVAVCSAARGASAPTEGGEWRGHIVAAARLQLVL